MTDTGDQKHHPSAMPTITLCVGQCGNQLGDTLWPLLFQASSAADAAWLGREFFSTGSSASAGDDCVFTPRAVCIDSEAKVVRSAGSTDHRVQVLGHSGCGNNWACGYSFGAGRASAAGSAWTSSDDALSRVEQVLEGVRKECELAAGVPDFLLLASLAGGTGSGMGSALLEALADGFPASTLGAVAVAPGHSGDSTVQSINSCLALQRLQSHAHAVVLLDNQAILDQLNSAAGSSASSSASSKQPAAAAGAARAAAVPAGACLQGVNRVAAEALTGLLWPASHEDLLAGRSSLRQLASTICADPLTKFVEVVSLTQPEAAWATPTSSSTRAGAAGNPWLARVKLLAAQLPRYDPLCRDTHLSTSAALVITRGLPGTCNPGVGAGRPQQPAAGTTGPWLASARPAAARPRRAEVAASCWHSGGACLGWQQQLVDAVCGSWPFFAGSEADVHLGCSSVPLWSAAPGATSRGSSGGSAPMPSMTAAVRRSSIGSLMRAAAQRALQLSAAGAYLHWYESYGTTRQDIEQAAFAVADVSEAYK